MTTAPTPSVGITVPEALLPAPAVDLARWAVVACDQFTSQPEYWEQADRLVGDAPSTLRLIFPEVYLGQDDARRIAAIQAAMRDYVARDLLRPHRGFILITRKSQGPHGPRTRHGLLACVDLEAYDYRPGSQSLVRATEGTIVERLPPRIRVREGAPLELPHVMLLIDDPARSVVEPLVARAASLRPLYDTELMLGGGHVTGHAVDGEGERAVFEALARLAAPDAFRTRYALEREAPVLLFAVGDGNHSLATAKAVWEQLKAAHGGAGAPAGEVPAALASHPARHALVEIVNVHDAGLEFEPIHRVLFDVKRDLGAALRERFGDAVRVQSCSREDMLARTGGGETHRIGLCTKQGFGIVEISRPAQALPVATLQPFLDDFLAAGGAHSIDYVHGTEALVDLGRRPGNAGLYLPAMPKSDLFRSVILDGALPRKTFSMGEAHEKRYYLEARRILP